MTLAIERIHNLPPHLSYVSTLPDITHKVKIYVVFTSVPWVNLKGTGLVCRWLRKEPVVWLDHNTCSKWRPFDFIHERSRVCHWSMALSLTPWVIRSQIVSSRMSHYSFFTILYHFWVIWCYLLFDDLETWVTEGHWKWRRSIDNIRLSTGPPL